jgi:hypothetical protein
LKLPSEELKSIIDGSDWVKVDWFIAVKVCVTLQVTGFED